MFNILTSQPNRKKPDNQTSSYSATCVHTEVQHAREKQQKIRVDQSTLPFTCRNSKINCVTRDKQRIQENKKTTHAKEATETREGWRDKNVINLALITRSRKWNIRYSGYSHWKSSLVSWRRWTPRFRRNSNTKLTRSAEYEVQSSHRRRGGKNLRWRGPNQEHERIQTIIKNKGNCRCY